MSALCPGLRLHDNEYVSQVLKSLNRIYNILDTEGNGSQLMNPDISGVIFTLSLSILILNSQCVEGARDVKVLKLTSVSCHQNTLPPIFVTNIDVTPLTLYFQTNKT